MNNYRFGKHPPKTDYRTLRLRDYLTAELAAPPASYDVLARVYDNLHKSDPTTLFPMDGNDTLGDCTIAALGHAITVYRGLVGKTSVPAKQTLVKLYMHLTGGVDSGLNELDVLNYWRQNNVSKEKILAFVSVGTKNHTHIQQAIQIFGGVYLGFQVQANCLQDFHGTHGPHLGKDTEGHLGLVGRVRRRGLRNSSRRGKVDEVRARLQFRATSAGSECSRELIV
jgi:hypothetical protein